MIKSVGLNDDWVLPDDYSMDWKLKTTPFLYKMIEIITPIFPPSALIEGAALAGDE